MLLATRHNTCSTYFFRVIKKQCTLRASSPYPIVFLPLHCTPSCLFLSPSLLPSLPLVMTMLVLTILLLISGAHSFQSGRQRVPSISSSFSSGVVYPSLPSTYSLILLPIGRISVRVGTRLLSASSRAGSWPSEVMEDTSRMTSFSPACTVHSVANNSHFPSYL